MIIATAGHVDHGKTKLVEALSGVNTDRLPEEKQRGLTIDLGFAYVPVAGGGILGFVDVPGHEKFIRNMVAGVSAIDYALLVIAADDGPMPQTANIWQYWICSASPQERWPSPRRTRSRIAGSMK